MIPLILFLDMRGLFGSGIFINAFFVFLEGIDKVFAVHAASAEKAFGNFWMVYMAAFSSQMIDVG